MAFTFGMKVKPAEITFEELREDGLRHAVTTLLSTVLSGVDLRVLYKVLEALTS